MSRQYSEQELRRIWLLRDLTEFQRRLPHALAKFYGDPAPSGEYLLEWTGHLKTVFADELQYGSHGEFVKDFLKFGGIPALLKLAESPSPNARISRVLALEAFVDLSKLGTFEENKQVAKLVYSEGGVRTLLRCLKSEYFTERAAAASALRGLCAYAEFGEFCAPEEISDIMKEVLEYSLKGHQPILDETFDPQKSFQMYHLNQETPEETRDFAPYWAGKHAEQAAWVAHALLCRSRPVTRYDCLIIIDRHPEIITLLLELAAKARTPWFPSSGADGMAMETLYNLLMLPYGFVPGISEDLTSSETDHFKEEIGYAIKCWKIFTRRPRWREKLLEVSQKLEDESFDQIRRYSRKFETSKQYLAPDEEPEEYNTINLMIARRSFIRVCVLKIFLTMTYLPASIVPLPVYLSILPLAYKASLPLSKPDEAQILRMNHQLRDEEEMQRAILDNPIWLKYQERVGEVIRVPESTVAIVSKIKIPGRILIAGENILGPTILFRVFGRLISENLVKSFAEIVNWPKLPDGSPKEVQLRQIKQIASLEVLGKFVRSNATKKMAAQLASGFDHLKSELEESETASSPGSAASTFMSAAELGLAIKYLDEVVPAEEGGIWATQTKNIEKDIALSFEGVGDAWLQWKDFKLSIWSYQRALKTVEPLEGETSEQEGGWDLKQFKDNIALKITKTRKKSKK
ncbi:hypothetical protein M422DRAFT_41781 [Sphaerobolus stellatus SS14]|nr:hypothetical protein M422DRAFT_41781 [Sphaerobolus stellatus SS14]